MTSVAVLVNPTAGRGKGGRSAPEVTRRLHERGIETVDLVGTSADAALALAREAVAAGVEGLVACGGDGTVHLALQAVAGTGVPLGIVPVGTGDDNARSLGLPRGDLRAAADVIADGRIRQVDVGRVTAGDGTQRWFLGVLSAGFDSLVNERANRMSFPRGQAKYLVATVAELGVFNPVEYRVDVDGDVREQRGMLVAVGNGMSYGGGMKVCPSAQVDDGLLTVTFLGEVGKPTFLRVFPKVFAGTHVEHPSVSEQHGRRIRIEASGQVAYADGERVGPLPIDVEVVPLGLRVFAP